MCQNVVQYHNEGEQPIMLTIPFFPYTFNRLLLAKNTSESPCAMTNRQAPPFLSIYL